MHHFGGGYADIKLTSQDWSRFFIELKNSNKFALGYQELPHGIPHIKNELGDELRANYKLLIGLCAFIFKPNTPLTNEWISETHNLLDKKLEELRAHPAKHPQDQTGVILPDGSVSNYPLRWAELLGEVFHPIIYRYKDKVIQSLIAPQFSNYR